MRQLFRIALLLVFVLLAEGRANRNVIQPGLKFITEPKFEPRIFNVTSKSLDASARASGYIFLTPPASTAVQVAEIYDEEGNLVWYADEFHVAHFNAQDLRVCDYLGKVGSHLCLHLDDYSDVVKNGERALKIILDNSYSQVGLNYTYPNGREGSWPNRHEFNVLKNGESFLQPVYRQIPMDLRPYNGSKDATFTDACFSEISLISGQPSYEWCFIEHFPEWTDETHARHGKETAKPVGMQGKVWDGIHLNSIDKTVEGDYLLSLRHLNEIMKIAGKGNRHGATPGSVLWRLGGDYNQFDQGDLSFHGQHDVRVISTSASEEVFSILNNEYTGTMKTGIHHIQKPSSGQIIKVNNATMTAYLVREFPQPSKAFASTRGSLQTLDNGNIFVGWGSVPELTEFLSDGTVIWHASFTAPGYPTWTYRAFKSSWIGRPKWKPKIVAHSCKCTDGSSTPLTAHVSWNGATEVANWRFHSTYSKEGNWTLIGTFKKVGFETRVQLLIGTGYPAFVFVEALDKSGEILGSVIGNVLTPNEVLHDICTSEACESTLETATYGVFACHGCWIRIIILPIFILGVCEAADWIVQLICV